MSNNKQGIRTIHDAIDAKVNRVFGDIRFKKSVREKEIENQVYEQTGISKLIRDWQTLTGEEPTRYSPRFNDNSILGTAMREARQELTKYDDVLRSIAIAAEDCHIQVAMGEMGEVLASLDKTLAQLQEKIKL